MILMVIGGFSFVWIKRDFNGSVAYYLDSSFVSVLCSFYFCNVHFCFVSSSVCQIAVLNNGSHSFSVQNHALFKLIDERIQDVHRSAGSG